MAWRHFGKEDKAPTTINWVRRDALASAMPGKTLTRGSRATAGRSQRPRKTDGGKPRLDLIAGTTIFGLGAALTFGADKYGAYNYAAGEGMHWSRYFAALMRHCWKWWMGEELDEESGLHHLHHAMACLDILDRMRNEEVGKDDRPQLKRKEGRR